LLSPFCSTAFSPCISTPTVLLFISPPLRQVEYRLFSSRIPFLPRAVSPTRFWKNPLSSSICSNETSFSVGHDFFQVFFPESVSTPPISRYCNGEGLCTPHVCGHVLPRLFSFFYGIPLRRVHLYSPKSPFPELRRTAPPLEIFPFCISYQVSGQLD